MDFSEIVRRRRMVRNFSPEPVPREVLERIAERAQRTPSAGFSQGQRLLVVTDPERRRRVGGIVDEAHYREAGYAGVRNQESLRAELAIPAEFTAIGVIPLGHPLPDHRSPSLKRGWVARQEFTHWETW